MLVAAGETPPASREVFGSSSPRMLAKPSSMSSSKDSVDSSAHGVDAGFPIAGAAGRGKTLGGGGSRSGVAASAAAACDPRFGFVSPVGRTSGRAAGGSTPQSIVGAGGRGGGG